MKGSWETRGMTLQQKLAHYTKRGRSNECWGWGASFNYKGYPLITWQGKTYLAQRLVSKPPKYLQIRHSCDNPGCMNQRHWSHGTAKQNSDDKFKRGRVDDRRGMKNGHAALTDVEVQQIRAIGRNYRQLSKQFGVGKSNISRIINRLSWTHVP
jgi:hypothetical protein